MSEKHFWDASSGLWLDYFNMPIEDDFIEQKKQSAEHALAALKQLEAGAIANPDEGRMVGHYWLRAPELAPTVQIKEEIESTIADISDFTAKVHSGEIKNSAGERYTTVLVIGIGGSSLGPKFVSEALKRTANAMELYFIDNTDPAGMEAVFSCIEPELSRTLCIVISKSGGTLETRNGMVEAQHFFSAHNLDFFAQTICITQIGSKLDLSGDGKWLARFPMWDWVGGRTSLLSAVGLLPLSLQGVDCAAMLSGARHADVLGRNADIHQNPALLTALCWLWASKGKSGTSMVMLPYKDSLELLSKYMQQLVMESLGKQYDLDGNSVFQGLAVYGNKGSSDQHAYVQQLLAAKDDFFINFINVMNDRAGSDIIVGENSTSGDYLKAFCLGTESALRAKEKNSLTISISEVNEYNIGILVALYERAVGLYAAMVNINAYHQPNVESGKKSASEIIEVKNTLLACLSEHSGQAFTVQSIAPLVGDSLGKAVEPRLLMYLVCHLGANGRLSLKLSEQLYDSTFCAI